MKTNKIEQKRLSENLFYPRAPPYLIHTNGLPFLPNNAHKNMIPMNFPHLRNPSGSDFGIMFRGPSPLYTFPIFPGTSPLYFNSHKQNYPTFNNSMLKPNKNLNNSKMLKQIFEKNDEMKKKVFADEENLSETFGENFGSKSESRHRMSISGSLKFKDNSQRPSSNNSEKPRLIVPRLVKRNFNSFQGNKISTKSQFFPEYKIESQGGGNYQLILGDKTSRLYNLTMARNLTEKYIGSTQSPSSEGRVRSNVPINPKPLFPRNINAKKKSTFLKKSQRNQMLCVEANDTLIWDKCNFGLQSFEQSKLLNSKITLNKNNQKKNHTSIKMKLKDQNKQIKGSHNEHKLINDFAKNASKIILKSNSSILQAKEEKLANDYDAGLIKLQIKDLETDIGSKRYSNFSKIKELDLKNEILVKPGASGSLFKKSAKELMLKCQNCECVVAEIETARRNYFISLPQSNQIFANFKLDNVSSIINKGESYPLQNLKKILMNMLLRKNIEPQMLDLNIFEIKLLHAVLIKRFKSFYVNSSTKMKKSPKQIVREHNIGNTFHEFLETKTVHKGLMKGFYKDTINQKNIFYNSENLKSINEHQFTSVFLNILTENEPSKRLEEQLKFVLSRAEQSLIVDFLRNIKNKTPEEIDKSLKTNRYSVEVEFYAKYFSSFAKEHGVPIEKFYFPRNKNKLVSNSHKTINKSYMRNITLNAEYVAKMKAHIQDNLLKLEKETIRVKINNKIEKWNSFLLRKINFEKEENILDLFDSFIETNILKNDKFKLPWSVKQIEAAISIVLDHLQ
jgi:hypothetical protein